MMADNAKVKKVRPDLATATKTLETRKLRNRLSQKAFRARQAVYIKEMERRLNDAHKPESQRIKDLEDSNRYYRDQLLDSHKTLESLQASLRGVLDGLGGVLGLQNHLNSLQKLNEDIVLDRAAPSNCLDDTAQSASPTNLCTAGLDGVNNEELFAFQNESQDIGSGTQQNCNSVGCNMDHVDMIENFSTDRNMSSNVLSETERIVRMPPSLPYKSTEMGYIAHKNLMGQGPVLMDTLNGSLHTTNSLLSDHIVVIEELVRERWKISGGLVSNSYAHLAASVSFMISIFVSTSWSPMTAFYTYTRAHLEVNKLTTWRVDSSKNNLTLAYQPTQLQLSVPHPAIIDWLPFPYMRDKLILHHAGNPRFDAIVTDLGDAYVIEGNLANLVDGCADMPCYIGVWDLVRSISPDDTSKFPYTGRPTPDSLDPFSIEGFPTVVQAPPISTIKDIIISPKTVSCLPARSIDALFTSRTLALAVFKSLGGDNGTLEFKMDPVFYEKHPEMYDYREKMVATGIALRPMNRERFPNVGTLDKNILGRYKEAINWAGWRR